MWTTVRKRDLISQLKNWRVANEMTLEKTAHLIGVSWGTVYRWESGKRLPHNFVADKVLAVIGGMR